MEARAVEKERSGGRKRPVLETFRCERPTPEMWTAVEKAHGDAEIPTRASRRPARPAPTPRHCHSGLRGLERAGPTLLSTLPSSSHPRRPHPLLPSSSTLLTPCPSHPLPARDTLTGSFAGPAHQFICWSFPRGPWQPSNPEPEAEGGQDPALIPRCQAICFTHQRFIHSSQTLQTQAGNW